MCPLWRAHCSSGPGCCNWSTWHLGRQCYSPITDLVLVWDQSSALCRSSTCHPCTCWLTLLISSLSRYLLYQDSPGNGWMRSCCCCHPCTSVVYVWNNQGMVIMKTIALRQFLLLTKFKICTVLPRNIMAVYEEDDLHCYRSITSKFCLTATYRCLCFELYFWNSSKLLAVVELSSWKRTIVLPSMRVKVLETGHHTSV